MYTFVSLTMKMHSIELDMNHQWRIQGCFLVAQGCVASPTLFNAGLCTENIFSDTLTTNLAAVVCVCVDVCQYAKFEQFLPARSYFESIRPENFVRIAKFPYAAFGPLFAFHCPLFFTRNNDLECKSSRFAVVVRRSVADKQLA